MSQGYGFSPKVVMRDTRLTVEAKAIYSYMASFAGSGLTAFPTIELQLHELGIGAKRYYKHRKLLENLGYITIKQTRIKKDSGKIVNDRNIYTLERFPPPKTKDYISNNSKESDRKNDNYNDIQNEQNEIIKLLRICQNNKFKLKKTDIKDLLSIYDFTKIAKAILTASSVNTKIKNYRDYLLATLNDMDKIKEVNINIDNKKTNNNDNFSQEEQYLDGIEC